MHHAVNLVLFQGALQRSLIAHIAFDQGNAAAGDLLHTAHSLRMAVAEVVKNHHIVTALDQFDGCVCTDIAGTAGEQGFHSAGLSKDKALLQSASYLPLGAGWLYSAGMRSF